MILVMEVSINCLPDQVLLYIFTCMNHYDSLDSVRLVCRRWHFLVSKAVGIMQRAFSRCDQFQWHAYRHSDSVTRRYYHSTCYHESSRSMLVFGGCTTSYTVFNDLWKFDLSSRQWDRVFIRSAPFPSPKALATLVAYGDDLILYGGFSKSYPNALRRISKYYDELHLFKFDEQRWIELLAENDGPKLAGHSAIIVDDNMIVFGGVSGEFSSNRVYVFDIKKLRWWCPNIATGECPQPRCNHSQALLDHNHLLIFGGSVGPSEASNSGSRNYALNDLWLLKFDLKRTNDWKWTKIKIINQEVSAWQLWLHAACNVERNIVAFGWNYYSLPSNRDKITSSSFGSGVSNFETGAFLQEEEASGNDSSENSNLHGRLGTESQASTSAYNATSSSDTGKAVKSVHRLCHCVRIPSEQNGSSSMKSAAGANVVQHLSRNFSIREAALGKLEKFNNKFMRKRLSVFVLDISLVLEDGTARWRKQRPEINAPYDLRSYSVCAGRGELILFGGVLSENNTAKLASSQLVTNNVTYILQPRYAV